MLAPLNDLSIVHHLILSSGYWPKLHIGPSDRWVGTLTSRMLSYCLLYQWDSSHNIPLEIFRGTCAIIICIIKNLWRQECRRSLSCVKWGSRANQSRESRLPTMPLICLDQQGISWIHKWLLVSTLKAVHTYYWIRLACCCNRSNALSDDTNLLLGMIRHAESWR